MYAPKNNRSVRLRTKVQHAECFVERQMQMYPLRFEILGLNV